MEHEELEGGGLPRGLILTGVVGLVLVAGIFGYLLLGPSDGPGRTNSGADALTTEPRENSLDAARDTLKRVTDLNAIRGAIQQLNSHLAEDGANRPPVLDEKSQIELRSLLQLQNDELAEIASVGFTQLDAHHLEGCFLFRDAGEAIRLGPVGARADGTRIARSTLEQARAAFDWTMRQVRLLPGENEPAPPQYVLRRGSGTALERALVFLALLDGLGREDGRVDGCLLWIREEPAKPPRLWACGLLPEGGKDIFLLDTRLGLPIPTLDGKGIATLADVRRQPVLLQQLTVGADKYDVSPAQAAAAELTLAIPLSAASPRMRHLQDKFLASIQVTLASDVSAELARWTAAAQTLGEKPPKVGIWPAGVSLLRRFLGPDDGGIDTVKPFPVRALPGYASPNDPSNEPMTRKRLFELTLVPWTGFPEILRDSGRFPGGLGRVMRDAYARPFIRSALEPGQPRDQIVRGDYRNAPQPLVQERDRLRKRYEDFDAQRAELPRRIDAWAQDAIRTYAVLLRPREDGAPLNTAEAELRLKELWNRAEAVELLLGGALAGPRGAEITWLLGLCKHEEAERIQTRIDLLKAAGGTVAPTELAEARALWNEAGHWWARYAEHYPTGPALAAARRLQARTEAMLGRPDAALALLADTSAATLPAERLAYHLEARKIANARK